MSQGAKFKTFRLEFASRRTNCLALVAGKMKTYFEYGAKSLSLVLTPFLILRLVLVPLIAQTLSTELHIVVVQGEGSTTDIRQRVSTEPVIRVEDEKQNPVPGAVAVFTLPTE